MITTKLVVTFVVVIRPTSEPCTARSATSEGGSYDFPAAAESSVAIKLAWAVEDRPRAMFAIEFYWAGELLELRRATVKLVLSTRADEVCLAVKALVRASVAWIAIKLVLSIAEEVIRKRSISTMELVILTAVATGEAILSLIRAASEVVITVK